MKYLGPDYPVYGIQARGLARPGPLPASIEQMAADYVDQIRLVQPVGPYCLLGWSLGGLVAHAVATELQHRGERVAFLANLDGHPGLLTHEDLRANDEEDILKVLLAMVACDVRLDGPSVTFAEVMDILRNQGNALASIDEYHVSAMAKISNNAINLVMDFTPRVFRGDLLLFIATIDQTENAPYSDAWEPYVDGVIHTHLIASGHTHMMQPESLAEIGPIVASKLREITGY